MTDEYKIIKEFICRGKQMVTIRTGNVAHVMSQEEWDKIYDRNHQKRWKTKVDWNRFVSRKQRGKKNVS